MLFVIQLNSVIMYLLIAAVIASAAIKATGDDKDKFLSYIDSIAIMIIVLINATIAAVTENNANDALEALSSLQSPISTVIRGGEEVQVESKDLVRGDIVKLGTGDVVPADVRCVKANDLRVNEMLLTGEPEDVAKSTKVKPRQPGVAEKLTADNMAFSSCNVKAGSAVGIIVATGMRTRVGTIAALLNDGGGDEDPDAPPQVDENGNTIATKPKSKSCLPDTKSGQSPLQHNLEALAVKLGYMAIAVCLVVFVVGIALNTKDPEQPDTPSWLFMILVAVTLTVAAIPEGLPLCVTIALSTGCKDMVKENVLMRKIAAVETLGSASIICTDKTGTLTEGKMTLVAMYADGRDYVVTGKGFDPTVGGIATGTARTPRATAASAAPRLGGARAPTPRSSSRRTPTRADALDAARQLLGGAADRRRPQDRHQAGGPGEAPRARLRDPLLVLAQDDGHCHQDDGRHGPEALQQDGRAHRARQGRAQLHPGQVQLVHDCGRLCEAPRRRGQEESPRQGGRALGAGAPRAGHRHAPPR